MNSRDELVRQLMRDQDSAFGAAGRMQREFIERQERMFTGVGRYAIEAAERAMSYPHRYIIEQLHRNMDRVQFNHIPEFNVPSISQQMAESIRQTALIPAWQHEAGRAITTLANTMGKYHADLLEDTVFKIRGMNPSLISGLSGSASLAALAYEQNRDYERLRSSFAGMITDALRDALRATNIDEASFARVEDLVNEKISSLPAGRITAEGMFVLFLQVVAVLISLGAWNTAVNQRKDAVQSSQVQTVQFTQLMGVLQRVAVNTEQLIPEHDENIYYVVERQVTLKLKPNNKAANVAILFPNQKTRLVQMNHKWIYVEYFDYLDGVPKYGWANKKYLARLDK